MAFRRLLANVSRVRAHIPNGAHAHSRGLQRFVNTGSRHSVRSNRMNKMAFHTRLPKWINGRVKFTTHCEAPTFGHPAQFGLSGSNHSNVFNDFDVLGMPTTNQFRNSVCCSLIVMFWSVRNETKVIFLMFLNSRPLSDCLYSVDYLHYQSCPRGAFRTLPNTSTHLNAPRG